MRIRIIVTPGAKEILKRLSPEERENVAAMLKKGIKWKFGRVLILNEDEIKRTEETLKENLEEIKTKYGMKYSGRIVVSYHVKSGTILVKAL